MNKDKVDKGVENGRGQADGATAKGDIGILKVVSTMHVVDKSGNIVSTVKAERRLIDLDEMDLSSIEGASRAASRTADSLISISRDVSKGTIENLVRKASKKSSGK